MIMLQLAQDEVTLFCYGHASFVSSLWGRGVCDFYFTNRRVVLLVEKGLFKKEILIYQDIVENIKIYKGVPQVVVSKSNATIPSVDIYFASHQVTLTFNNDGKKASKELIYQAKNLLRDPEYSGYDGYENSKMFAFDGVEEVARTLKGTFDVIKDTFIEKGTVVCGCRGCGAQMSGIRGSIKKCSFCGTINKL